MDDNEVDAGYTIAADEPGAPSIPPRNVYPYRWPVLALRGVDCVLQIVEADAIVSTGYRNDGTASLRETRLRVESAIRVSQATGIWRVSVEDAGAHDLTVALARAYGRRPAGLWSIGDLSLDGTVRPARGLLARLRYISGVSTERPIVLVPAAQAEQARMFASELAIVPVATLAEALGIAACKLSDPQIRQRLPTLSPATPTPAQTNPSLDTTYFPPTLKAWAEKAQEELCSHAFTTRPLILFGPPGSGAMMLARRLNTLRGRWYDEDRREATIVAEAAGMLSEDVTLLPERPFRAPHHTVSEAGLIGGGHGRGTPRPGEASLAHGGVLYLESLDEFRVPTLDTLTEVVRDRVVSHRNPFGGGRISIPADAWIVASTTLFPGTTQWNRRIQPWAERWDAVFVMMPQGGVL